VARLIQGLVSISSQTDRAKRSKRAVEMRLFSIQSSQI
jgi:hypothetical protein